ncbi:MAG: CDP-alcohol phosphatidyltransferase family protein [Thermoleophilaceae bacterium]
MTTELQSPPTRRQPVELSGGIATAILFATAPAEGGRPAATLPWEDHTLVGQLLRQLVAMGVPKAYVITRPEWEDALRAAIDQAGAPATLQVSAGPSQDLAAVAELARERRGGLVVALADIVTHRGALEGLLASPGVVTGVLSTGSNIGLSAMRTRMARGRVVSAGSAYHAVAAPRATFLSVLKVAGADNEAFVEVAEHLSELMADGLPEGWERELEHKEEEWRLGLARNLLRAQRREARDALDAAGRSPDELPAMTWYEYGEERRALARSLPPAQQAELGRQIAAARQDVVSLLLVGLIRRGVHIGNNFLRRLYWSRPLSPADADQSAVEIQDYDEDRVLLDSAVKGSDGFFTTVFVSTWSRYVARWAARAGLTPNQVTCIALCIGLLGATAFATGERAGYIAGAVLVYLSFVADCVDGQLARYTRSFSKFGAWLDSVFDRAKEYAAFAGLGIGASSPEVWALGAAALTLQTLRHSFDFSYGATDRQNIADTPHPPIAQSPDDTAAGTRMKARGTLDAKLGALRSRPRPETDVEMEFDDNGDEGDDTPPKGPRPLSRRILGFWRAFDRRIPGVVWIKKMAAFPIGERFAVICVTTAIWEPRTTFIVLLAWGGFALLYTSTGRVLRTIAQWRTLR